MTPTGTNMSPRTCVFRASPLPDLPPHRPLRPPVSLPRRCPTLGYETDSYTLLPPGTVCAAGLTVSNLNFAGSDFVRRKLHINLTAQTGTWTTTRLVAVLLQSSPDGGSTFYPDVAATVAAGGYASSTTIAAYHRR